MSVHAIFDSLDLWFEGTDEVCYPRVSSSTIPTYTQPDRYNVCVSDPGHWVPLLRVCGHHADTDRLSVTFSQSPESLRHGNLELPDPRLLALHVACARVVHMSGAAEAFDELDRDVEDIRVLAFDGSSARLLDHLLTPFAVVPGVA